MATYRPCARQRRLAGAGSSEIGPMDLPEKTDRTPNRLSPRAIGRAILHHLSATAYRRAIASLNDFQLRKLGVRGRSAP